MQARMIDMELNTTLVQCYPAHEARPDGAGPFPAVVVLHGPFGLDPGVKGVAGRLARAGFYALAPDFYATPISFAGVAPDYMRMPTGGSLDYRDPERAFARAAGVSDEHARRLLRQAIAYAGTRPQVRSGGVGIVGFSTGARWALLAACLQPDDVKACVTFYPAALGGHGSSRDSLLDRLHDVRCPVLVLAGGLDTGFPARAREAVRDRLAHLGSDFQMQIFREASHDFFEPARDAHDISSSRAAWTATLDLLKRTLPAG